MKRLFSIEEATDYLGVRKSTLYTWARRRVISSVKIGRRLLFDIRDLDRLIEDRKRKGSDRVETPEDREIEVEALIE